MCVTHNATRINQDDDKTKIHPPIHKRIIIDVSGGITTEKIPSQKRSALGFSTVRKRPSTKPEAPDLVVCDFFAETSRPFENSPFVPKYKRYKPPPTCSINATIG